MCTATARTGQLLVLTANVADFERIDNVAVVNRTARSIAMEKDSRYRWPTGAKRVR